MFNVLLLLAGSVLACAYLYWSRVRRFWAERGVPHEPPHPVYGSLTFLQKQNPAIFMRKLYEQFKKPYVGIWLFWRPALVINSPDIARNILVKHSDNFRNRFTGSGSAKSDPIGGLHLFTVREPLWSSVRRRLTPVFTSSKLRALHDLQITKSKELVQRLDNDLSQKKKIEIRSLYADFTTDVIGTAAFGAKFDSTLTGESPMRTVTKDFMKYDFIRGWAWISIFFLPELVNFFKFTFFPKHTVEYFRKLYGVIVAQRGEFNSDSPVKDLLDALLKMKHDAIANGEEMSDDLVIAQAAVFLQAGFDTSAVSLSFVTYELAFHPEAQEKLYQELLEAKKKLGGKDFDGNVLSELPYLNCVIKEALRKYPVMGWLDRIADKDYKVDENLTIPGGTVIYVNAIGMHYDPEFYPEPEKFIPERFLPENLTHNSASTFMPFGEGPRNCIGMRFAYRTIWYALSAVLLKYQVRAKPNAKMPTQVEIEKKGLFLMPGEGLYVDFIPRY